MVLRYFVIISQGKGGNPLASNTLQALGNCHLCLRGNHVGEVFSQRSQCSSERTSKSSDPVGSPAPLLATRDWFNRSSLPSSPCVSLRCCRCCLRWLLSPTLRSTQAASSGVNSRHSSAAPTFQPLAVSCCFWCFSIGSAPGISHTVGQSHQGQPHLYNCLRLK